jgi:hypothetical protein
MIELSHLASEVDAVDYDITIPCRKNPLTEIESGQGAFAGKVIYRHPAPGWRQEFPDPAISAEPLTAAIHCRGELDELAAQTGPVQFASIALCCINFYGRFVRSEPILRARTRYRHLDRNCRRDYRRSGNSRTVARAAAVASFPTVSARF